MNRGREMAAAEELMRLGRMPAPDQLKGDGVSLMEVLRNPVPLPIRDLTQEDYGNK